MAWRSVVSMPLTRSTAIRNCAYLTSEDFSERSALPELKPTARVIASEVCETGFERGTEFRRGVRGRAAGGGGAAGGAEMRFGARAGAEF